jgi:outer membrane protein assembly factor BamB
MKPKVVSLMLALLLAGWAIANAPASAHAGVIPNGTVMLGTVNGFVTEFDQNGNMLGQLNTMTGAPGDDQDGGAFDSSGNYFVTDFNEQMVTKFDPSGVLIGPFGAGYNMSPESIVFDAAGNAYVGQADGTHHVLEFNSSGTLLHTFAPAVEDRGTDWIELAADNCTLFYTSEGAHVKRYNLCTLTQLADFNATPLPGTQAFAHRILLPFQFGAGGVLVADSETVERLDPSGNLVQTYTFPGFTQLFALSLDPDGTSFWTADFPTGQVFKVDIQTGTVLKSWSSAGAPNFLEAGGLVVKGELTAPLPPPDCSMAAASAPLLWPPNHKFVSESVLGVTAVNGPVTIDITGIFQDQSPTGKGSGHTCPDGKGIGTSTAMVRAERSGGGDDGRVYTIDFTATDQKNEVCTGAVTVCVSHDQGGDSTCVDHGPLFDSTVCP